MQGNKRKIHIYALVDGLWIPDGLCIDGKFSGHDFILL